VKTLQWFIGAGVVALGVAVASLALTGLGPGTVIASLVAGFGVAALALLAAGLALRTWRGRVSVPPILASLLGLWRVAAGMILAAGAAGLALWATSSAIQPPTICGPGQSASSQPPASRVTAADYFAQGDYDFDRGDCAAAVADYTRSIALDPRVAQVYNNRAYTYMAQHNYAAALADLDRALQLRPDYVNALMNRGDIHNYYYAIDYQLAVADYDRVLQLDPTNPTVCGHRLLALHHGWDIGVFGTVFLQGAGQAGCK
jgi:tetratricopeptide (TPR) repeat protein